MDLVVGLSKWNSIPIPILVSMQSCLSWIDPGRPAILVEKFGHEFFFLPSVAFYFSPELLPCEMSSFAEGFITAASRFVIH